PMGIPLIPPASEDIHPSFYEGFEPLIFVFYGTLKSATRGILYGMSRRRDAIQQVGRHRINRFESGIRCNDIWFRERNHIRGNIASRSETCRRVGRKSS